ncbi:hypothetical protein BVG19_g3342 [[Candida] boidinii]|nr:hypothetical protein BVG19_g3342 [[Candida] boidinii]OWB52117.1 hypothetical protein B5S27_g3689 [[Candida] boidinii]OWB70166.1 hypothetical protein B5S30_g5631 [[Candida] boidinii]OWB85447.1 hypothetical protein B5S33_g4114 [[Candida] boidinii]
MSVTVTAEFLRVKLSVSANQDSGNGTPILKDLLTKITSDVLIDQKDYDVFIEDETVRPGILVLINDTDWELEGEDEYQLENGDIITFTSTLHGG